MADKIFIGPLAPDSSYVTVGYRTNLDDFAENAECKEINAPNILDFVEVEQHASYIQHLVSKLRHGGTLVIGGTDIISVSLAIFNKSLTNEQANHIIYGVQTEPVKKGLSCLEDLRKLLLSCGLKIKQQIPGLQMLIVASRI